MNTHQDALKQRCRLCGVLLGPRPCAITPVADLIRVALDIDVSEDDANVHPPFICGGCLRKLQRWKKGQSKKGKVAALNITVYPFGPHDDRCTTCIQVKPELNAIVGRRAREFEELTVNSRRNRLLVVELDEEGNAKKTLTVYEGGSWHIRAYGRLVKDHPTFSAIPCQLNEDSDIDTLLKLFVECKVCTGNEFSLTDAELEGKPVYRHHCPDSFTIRHRSCPLLTDRPRCGPCSIYRSTLAASCKTTNQPSTSQNTPYQYLPRKEVEDRLRKAHGTVRSMRKKINKLEERIAKWVREEGQELPSDQTKKL
nr:V(D)J recombination-activating protein 1-like [Lytechinus pictus]